MIDLKYKVFVSYICPKTSNTRHRFPNDSSLGIVLNPFRCIFLFLTRYTQRRFHLVYNFPGYKRAQNKLNETSIKRFSVFREKRKQPNLFQLIQLRHICVLGGGELWEWHEIAHTTNSDRNAQNCVVVKVFASLPIMLFEVSWIGKKPQQQNRKVTFSISLNTLY